MQGDYYSRRRETLEPLQRIGADHEADWELALAGFHAARHRATDRHASNPTNVRRGDAVTYWTLHLIFHFEKWAILYSDLV